MPSASAAILDPLSHQDPNWDDRDDAMLRAARQPNIAAADARPYKPTPTLARYYAVTLMDVPGTGVAITALSVPRPEGPILEAAFGAEDLQERAAQAAYELGFTWRRPLPLGDLPRAVIATQARGDRLGRVRHELNLHAGDPEHAFDLQLQWADTQRSIYPSLGHFAARVVGEPAIPFEQSAAEGTSLLDLVSKTGGAISLGYLGSHYDPWLFLYAPVGLVLMGAATGVAKGLEQALHRNILKWMTGEKQIPPDEADESE